MGFLSEIHESRGTWTGPYSFKDPALAKIFGGGAQTFAGVTVTDQLVMTCSAVYDAVNTLSSDIAKMPLNLLKRLPNGGSEHYFESKTYHLLKTEPNSEMGPMTFKQTLLAHALTLGGGYAEIERNQLDQPVHLWPITPDRIRSKRTAGVGTLYYDVDNGKHRLASMNVLHLHGLGYDGTSGYALIDLARQVVGLALASERYASLFFGNNAALSGVVGFEGRMGEEELKNYREALEAGQRTDKAFRLLLLDGGAKFQPFTSTNQNAQLDELRDKQIEEVSRFYRIPVHKLNSLKRATFSNVEQQDLEYYKGPILDWATLLEQECARKLIPRLERRQQFFKHNANVFLRGDIVSRFTALGIARDKGIINANEWRDLEDMNPQEGAQGSEYLVQSAQVPARLLTQLAEAQIAKTKREAEPQPPPPSGGSKTNDAGDDDAINERVARAEQLTAELRTKLETEIEGRALAEGARETLTAEVERRRVDEEAARTALEAIRQDATRLEREGVDVRAELAAAQQALTDTRRELESTEAARAAAVADVELHQQAVAEVGESLHNLSVIEATLRSEQVALQADRAEVVQRLDKEAEARQLAEAELRQAVQRAESAEGRVSEVQSDLVSAREELDGLRAKLTGADALAETAVTDRAAVQAAADECRSQLEAAQARVADLERSVGQVQFELTHAQEAVAAARLDVDRAHQTISEQERSQASLSAAAAATVAAHRHLYVHIMRGAIEREADRARRAQQTPEKLRQWIDSWYEGHAELMHAALLPAVKIHHAWLGDESDAGELTRALVAEHIGTSRRQLQAVVNGDAAALAGSLAGLLRRWETERIHEIPDRLMEKEVAHARS